MRTIQINHLIFFIVIFFSVFSAQAKEADIDTKEKTDIYEKQFLVGSELRYEKDSSENLAQRNLPRFSILVANEAWGFGFDYAEFSESSGNEVLYIERRRIEALLTAVWYQKIQSWVTPYFIFQAGLGRERILTKLYTEQIESAANPKPLVALGAGAQTMLTSFWLLSFEARLLTAEDMRPQPTMSFAVKTGFVF